MADQNVPKVKAVILDVGNVLVFHDNELLYRRLGESAGFCAEAVARLVSAPHWESIHNGDWDAEEIRRQGCGALGVALDREEFAEIWNSHFTANEDILPLVEGLIGRVKLVALSNTNAIHAEYLLHRFPLLGKFDHLLFSHQLKRTKPDPEIYREALRRAGTVASETAFFDDLPEYVEAARRLGLLAYVYRSADEFA